MTHTNSSYICMYHNVEGTKLDESHESGRQPENARDKGQQFEVACSYAVTTS